MNVSGSLVVGQDHAQDDAGGDADEKRLAAIVTDIVAPTWGRPQAIISPVNVAIAVAVIVRQTVAATPSAIRSVTSGRQEFM